MYINFDNIWRQIICTGLLYHEAAEDAGYRNDGISFLSIIGPIIFVVLLILFIPLIIRNKMDDYKFNKVYPLAELN